MASKGVSFLPLYFIFIFFKPQGVSLKTGDIHHFPLDYFLFLKILAPSFFFSERVPFSDLHQRQNVQFSIFVSCHLSITIHVPLAVISFHHALRLGWLLNFSPCLPSQEGNHVVPTVPPEC